MNSTIHHNSCPVCKSEQISKVLTAKDYTVSNEDYEIWHCQDCTFRFTQNIPSAEHIGRYYQSSNYVSHSNSDKGIINKLYHAVRKYTLQSKLKLVQQFTQKQTGSLLDVGAGTGYFAATMQQAGWKVTALEPDETARRNALEVNNIQLKPLSDFYNLEPGSFDCITLWHVLEHVHDLHSYIHQFKTLLKPDGKLLIAVPNYTSYDSNHYQQYWAAYDVPRHLWHFSPESLIRLIEDKGFSLKACKPMWFDSFYVSMLSEQYKRGTSNLIAACVTGLKSNFTTLRSAQRCSSVIYCIELKH